MDVQSPLSDESAYSVKNDGDNTFKLWLHVTYVLKVAPSPTTCGKEVEFVI